MTKANPTEASPEQVVLYGQVAARLRQFIDAKGWSPSMLRDKMEMAKTNPVVYHWLAAKGAPSPKYRVLLSKVTGIPEHLLLASDAEVETTPIAVTMRSDTSRVKLADVLSFVVDADGQATVKLNVTLPVEQALPLLRLITDYPAMRGNQ